MNASRTQTSGSLVQPHVATLVLLQTDDGGFWRLQPLAQQLLNGEERSEFGRIRSAAVRSRRIACRAWLRFLLGRALGMAPDAVALFRGIHGRLEVEAGPRGMFNVSQSDGVLAIALLQAPRGVAGLRIGVDVETPARRWTPDLAAALFSAAEMDWLSTRPPALRDASFLLLWTLREAVMKADGRGLSMDLRQIRFKVDSLEGMQPGAAGVRVELERGPQVEPTHWRCWARLTGDTVCAVAVQGSGHCGPLALEVERVSESEAARLMREALQLSPHLPASRTPASAVRAGS